ncbi:MAG TPA: type III pantothenate kinase [Azospirillaceae bacterium]|nr:type III pantothenate kinase [Azospirillaceae bacterium]
MLLAIDAGNTNVVFAIYDGDVQRGMWRCATDPRRTGDEYAVWLIHLMALKGLNPCDITAAIVGSVVPQVTFNLKRLCKGHFNCEPLQVGSPSVKLGAEAKVDRPEEVGADRLVNAVAAAATYTPPLIVIDFGTATTFDVVDDDGNYAGGVIAPGINLSLEALHMAAAKLPRVDIVQPSAVIGKSTVACMQSGIFWGYIGLIEGLIRRIQAEYGGPMTVVGTGGLAVLFARATNVIQHIDGELTLRGLLLIHQRNANS